MQTLWPITERSKMRAGGLRAIVLGALVAYPLASVAGPPDEVDGDGIPDVLDKCMFDSRNLTASCDTDQDGYGNPCDADFNQNGVVNAVDFATYFIPAFRGGPSTRGEDMNCNGATNAVDFADFFVPKFRGQLGGAVPGPSGLACAGTIPCN